MLSCGWWCIRWWCIRRSNVFLKKTEESRTTVYNDISVHENAHVARAYAQHVGMTPLGCSRPPHNGSSVSDNTLEINEIPYA